MIRRQRQRGNTLMESILFLPILFMLLFGMVALARITWTYFTLQKILYTVGRYAATQPAVNFCDDADPILADAKNLAIRGIGDAAGDLQLPNLTADLIQVRLERIQTDTAGLAELSAYMKGDEVRIHVSLATGGTGSATVWGCDLTDGYVRINADYTT